MERIILIVCLCLIYSLKGFGQFKEFTENDEGELEFSEVIATDLPAGQMYQNAKEWVVKNFDNYKSAVELEDDVNKKLFIKGSIFVPLFDDGDDGGDEFEYLLTIECKDKKYKYRFNNIQIRTIKYSSYNILLKDYIEFLNRNKKELDKETKNDQSKLKEENKNDPIGSLIASVKKELSKIISDNYS